MNLGQVIKKTILSEKAYALMENGVYTFLVDRKASKDQIKRSIEDQFSVKVIKVNVTRRPKKMKRIARTRKQVATGGGKKAVVWLAKGQSISMLKPKNEKAKGKKSKDKSEKTGDGKEEN